MVPSVKLTKSAIDALPILAKNAVYCDAACPGFGVKVNSDPRVTKEHYNRATSTGCSTTTIELIRAPTGGR